MARSIKKGPFVDKHLIKKVEDANKGNKKRSSRPGRGGRPSSPSSWASPSPCTTAGSSCPVFVTENMVGHKLGEFAPTRTFHGHSAEKKVATTTAPPPKK